LDPSYRAGLLPSGARTVAAAGREWFVAEQKRIHTEVNRVWPRQLGTTPMGMARALNEHSAVSGVRYRWRIFRSSRLPDISRAVGAGWPVAVLIGQVIPRHWVLLVAGDGAGSVECYEPSSGGVLDVAMTDMRRARLTGLGYPRVFAVVLPEAVPSAPSDSTRSATT
jgi:hypothetical protein